MNEQLQSKLVEILSSMQEAAKATGDFAMAQLPEIAQMFVLYGRVSTILFAIMGLALCVAGLWLFRLARRSDTMSGDEMGGVIGGFLCMFLGAPIFGLNLSHALLVWFAPKVWLLKEIAGLLK